MGTLEYMVDESEFDLAVGGMATELVQTDASLPTGFVRVSVDEQGLPDYEIVRPAAWDTIELRDDLARAAAEARAVVFGSLAQRDAVTRRTVQTLAASPATAVFDVNMRPPYVDRAVIDQSLQLASFVKMNEDELLRIARWSNWSDDTRDAVQALADTYGCDLVCVTRGERGALLWHGGIWTENGGYPVEVRDTVGSGDAFLAALLAGVLDGLSDAQSLDLACRLGAFVATRSGATPAYDAVGVADVAGLVSSADDPT